MRGDVREYGKVANTPGGCESSGDEAVTCRERASVLLRGRTLRGYGIQRQLTLAGRGLRWSSWLRR